MSEKVRIQDDLYEFINGEWLATAVIPDDKPTTGGFANLAVGVEEKLMADFRAFANAEKSTDVDSMQDAVNLYKLAMDSERRNREGIEPLLPLLEKIQSIDSVEKLNASAKDLLLAKVPLPVSMGVDSDMKDATTHCFYLLGPSIILPDTTYYGQPTGDQLLAAYSDMAGKVLAYTNLSPQQQKQYLEDTLAFDRLVAKSVKSQLEWADYVKNYNPESLEEVCQQVAPFDLKGLLSDIYGQHLPEQVVVYDPRAIKETSQYFNEEKFSLYIHWAYVRTLLSNTAVLSEEIAALGTTYRRVLMGVKSDPTLEKQAYQTVSSIFSEPVGIYYGREYFGEEAKKDITDLVKKIIEAYKGRMTVNSFLEEATKQKAILKLSTIAIHMGYPDKADDFYKQLKVNPDDSYFVAMSKISTLRIEHNLSELYEKVNKEDWVMPGHMVNACYDPSRNTITFPAAILQKPFYSIQQTVSENLGGIGAVIAHEISHAFDNNGACFDENGNLENWWTEKDFAAFKQLTQLMIEQWDGIEYGGGKVNGELVVSENIADNGGIAVTLEIMHQLGNTSFTEYFYNWAKVWCMKAKPEYIQLLLKNDVHSPAKLRANIQIRNFKEWYETFDVQSTDQMYIPEDKRIIIW